MITSWSLPQEISFILTLDISWEISNITWFVNIRISYNTPLSARIPPEHDNGVL